MPWCPNCKNEYVEGISVCADCGATLVASLNDIVEVEPITFGTKEEMEQLRDFLVYSKIKSVRVRPSEENGIYELCVSINDRQSATRLASVLQQELMEQRMQRGQADSPAEDAAEAVSDEEAMQDATQPVLPRVKVRASSGVYVDSAKKAEETKSGAYTLLLGGGLGMIGLGLLMSGVLPIHLNPSSQILTCLVMGGLFLFFIVMGVQSLKSYKEQTAQAVTEHSLKDEMMQFAEEYFQAEKLDQVAAIQVDDMDEMKYFKRSGLMKYLLAEHFPNQLESYLDSFVDEIYPKIFE